MLEKSKIGWLEGSKNAGNKKLSKNWKMLNSSKNV